MDAHRKFSTWGKASCTSFITFHRLKLFLPLSYDSCHIWTETVFHGSYKTSVWKLFWQRTAYLSIFCLLWGVSLLAGDHVILFYYMDTRVIRVWKLPIGKFPESTKHFLSEHCTDLSSSSYHHFYTLQNGSKWLLLALLLRCCCIAVACTALALVCMFPLICDLRMSLI